MIRGRLVAEGVMAGSALEFSGVRFTRLERVDVGDSAASTQPQLWTLIDFEADDDAVADVLAEGLAGVLIAADGWYADFTVGDDHVVVFANKVFRYRRGDDDARSAAVSYGLQVGTPAHQLDWGT
jgi:hypothetical protein